MKKRERISSEPKIVLSWLFRQKDRLLTCGVSQAAGAAFEVVTVPHWDINRGTVERFSGAMEALERHAQISSALRTAGWAPASYTR